MSISARISTFLDKQGVNYHTIKHHHSKSSVGSALAAQIPLHKLAKGVVLEDHQGKKMIAILPTDYKVSLQLLNERFNAKFHLLQEQEVYPLFDDCDLGAVPPIGEAYHINAIYDDVLLQEPDIYLEAGDHETLIHLDKQEFIKLMERSQHTRFSRQNIY